MTRSRRVPVPRLLIPAVLTVTSTACPSPRPPCEVRVNAEACAPDGGYYCDDGCVVYTDLDGGLILDHGQVICEC